MNDIRSLIRKTLCELKKDKEWQDPDFYLQQKYSDQNGEWLVPDLLYFAEKNSKLRNFDVEQLAELAFMPSEEEQFDELLGSPEFVERAMESDLEFPIVVIRYDDGDFVADGNHRLWKAMTLGHKEIKGYLLYQNDLSKISQID